MNNNHSSLILNHLYGLHSFAFYILIYDFSFLLLWLFSLFLCVFCAFLWLKNLFNQRNPRLNISSCSSCLRGEKIREISVNPWLINDLRARIALYICRGLSTTVESSLQIKLFMQNKPNFRKSQMNVCVFTQKAYENWTLGERGKNKANSKPIQSQTKPIPEKAKINVNNSISKDYENKSHFWVKAKQTQFKPKQTQFQGQKMLLCMTINPRRNPLGYYADWRFFAADQGPNLSCFAALLFAHGLIFSEKKQQIREIPDKAGAGLCRFVYIRKSLLFCQGQGIIIVDFRLRIEDKHW